MPEGATGRSLNDMLAERFHDTYERLAPAHGYETRRESAVPWAEVPEQNKALMRAVVAELRGQGYVVVPFPVAADGGCAVLPSGWCPEHSWQHKNDGGGLASSIADSTTRIEQA